MGERMTPPPGHGAVRWLTAQAVLFGVMAALLGIAANAMFLEAYGPGWLPLTYILIGAVGATVSSGVAGSARRFHLVRIAVDARSRRGGVLRRLGARGGRERLVG